MTSGDMTFYMIMGCIAFIMVMFLSKPLFKILKLLMQGIIGALGIYLLNFLLLPVNLSVGINLVTITFIGILGVPGFISLYALSFIL